MKQKLVPHPPDQPNPLAKSKSIDYGQDPQFGHNPGGSLFTKVKNKIEKRKRYKRLDYFFENRESLLGSANYQMNRRSVPYNFNRSFKLKPLKKNLEEQIIEESDSQSQSVNQDTYSGRTDDLRKKCRKRMLAKKNPFQYQKKKMLKKIPTDFIGFETNNIFYKQYRYLRQKRQQIGTYNLLENESSYTRILDESEKMSLFPKKLGLFKV